MYKVAIDAILSYSVPAITNNILVWTVGPRQRVNYFSCAA